MQEKAFDALRRQFPVFVYEDYHLFEDADFLHIVFDFQIEGLCAFHPSVKIQKSNLDIVNAYDSPAAKKIAFNLGMVELISYWKSACPPTVRVQCGNLSPQDIAFWKRLYFGGLSEFFYINGIKTDENSFMTILCTDGEQDSDSGVYKSTGINLIPIGGGKDSAVTAELLRPFGDKNRFFTVNNQPARTQTVLAAGYTERDIVRTFRTIDPALLRLNQEGFLNGHTPFSAIVAFLSLYCAHLIGAAYIVLSNEASANESNIAGTDVNHQYSKSYQFENDFTEYVKSNGMGSVQYFSLLRPFSELQIAKMFAHFPQYHRIFRSCNRGSKQNIWCAKCAKCLFVYCILAPFLPTERLTEIFGGELLADAELTEIFDGLAGFSPVKPFECVGTVSELCFALNRLCAQYERTGGAMPCLLRRYCDKANKAETEDNLLNEYNPTHNVPEDFLFAVKEMYEYVAENC